MIRHTDLVLWHDVSIIMGIIAVDLKIFCLILDAKEKLIEYPFTHINVIIDFFLT